eukprot:g4053.t1
MRPASWAQDTHTNGFIVSSSSSMDIDDNINQEQPGSWTIDQILNRCPDTTPFKVKNALTRMKDNDVRSEEIETLLTTPFFSPAGLTNPYSCEIKERLAWWNKHLKARDKVQMDAKNNITRAFITDKKPRALLEVACGAGKTHIAINTAEELIRTKDKFDEFNIIVFEPTLELIRQTVRKWNAFFLRNEREEGKFDVQVVTVCSLSSLNQKKKGKKSSKGTNGAGSDENSAEECDITGAQLEQALQDDTALPKEWTKVIKKTNNSSDPIVQLKNFLMNENDKPIVRVVFVCYLSSSGISDALESMTQNERMTFDFGIFDEAHVTATKEIDKKKAGEYQIGLKDEKIGIVHRLFMTATANVKSAKDLSVRDEDTSKDTKKSKENILINMKNNVEDYGGEPVYELSLTDAIEQSIVCDYQLAVVCMTGSEWSVHDIGGTVSVTDCGVSLRLEDLGLSGKVKGKSQYPNYARNHPTQEHPSALEIAQIYGFLDICKKKKIKKAFTFHGTIPQSRRIQTIANHLKTKDKDIPNDHKFEYVDSKDDNMTQVLKTFKTCTTKAWLSNPRTLAVGIDAPSMEGVAIMSSMSSSVNIAQILGRPLRMDPNNRNKQAYIMLPYFVDEMDHATESENTELWDNTSSRNAGPSTSESGSKQRGERWYKKYTWEGTWDRESGLSALKTFCEENERVPMYSKPKGNQTEKDEIEKENRLASFMHSMRKEWLKNKQTKKSDSNNIESTDTSGAGERMYEGNVASGGVPEMVISHWKEKQGDNTSSQRKFANIFAALSSIDSRMRHVRDGQQRAMVMLDKCLRSVFSGSELTDIKRKTNAEKIEQLRMKFEESGGDESAVDDLDEVVALCKAFSERISISRLSHNGTSISIETLKEQVKGRLVEISGKAFDWRAEELVDQLNTIILHAGKEDKTE